MQCLVEIHQKVKEAMVAACGDMLTFTDEPARKINAEYLFTVNVAKAISKLNSYHADPYKITLEHDTRQFARNCLRPILFGPPLQRGSSVIRRGTPKIDRNGRIDIAVYLKNGITTEYAGGQPLCAIELKAFNPSRTLVLKDLKRNLEFLRVSGNTGRSVLAFTLFAALHSFERLIDTNQLQGHVEETQAKYKKWLTEIGRLDDVAVAVDTFTVSQELLGRIMDEGGYQVLDTDAVHHYVGVIVRFSNKMSD